MENQIILPQYQAVKDLLFSTQLPAETKTYAPVSHQTLYEAVRERIDKQGLILKDERFSENRSGQQMFASLVIQGLNDEQDFQLGFRNSYDKSLQLGLAAGSRVIVCANMMFKGDHVRQVMHWPGAGDNLTRAIDEIVGEMEKAYKDLQRDSKKMKRRKLQGEDQIEEIIRRLREEEGIIKATQEKVLRGEIVTQERFELKTIWDLYNHTTEALKTSHTSLVMDNHTRVHDFFLALA